jgi:hypothetical protein
MGQVGGTMLYASEKVSIQSIIGMSFMIGSMIVTYWVLAPSDAFVPGLGLGSEGLALKMVTMQFIQVNFTAYIISRIWHWEFDWIHQPISLICCLGLGWTVNFILSGFSDIFSWFIILLLSGCSYILLVMLLVYMLPWLIDMTRKEIHSIANSGVRELQHIFTK